MNDRLKRTEKIKIQRKECKKVKKNAKRQVNNSIHFTMPILLFKRILLDDADRQEKLNVRSNEKPCLLEKMTASLTN